MSILRRRGVAGFCLLAFFAVAAWQFAAADELTHSISGFVKHVDRGTKTMVVKAEDGTEHTIKWTGKTAWEGTEDAGKDIKEGAKVSVKYTEKGGEKTAVGVKHLAKDATK
jgi:Cu/Ag efflux protein CusF